MNILYIILIAIGVFALFVLFGLAIVNKSGEELFDKFKETSQYPTAITPLDFAHKISSMFFKNSIKIQFDNKLLSDSFSLDGKLTLCSQYANSSHLAGLAIVAHELGHVFQYYQSRQKMIKHAKKLRLSQILSRFTTPIFIACIILLCFGYYLFSGIAGALAVVFFIMAISVKMSTLKIEKEASQIAIDLLKDIASLDEQQIKKAKKFLDSAKLTYIADMLKVMLKWTWFTRK